MKRRTRLGDTRLLDSYADFPELDENREKLRDKLLMNYLRKKTDQKFDERIRHINGSREVSEHIRFFFDDKGQLPQNVTAEDIRALKQRIESEISWLEAIVHEFKRELRTLESIEKSARLVQDLKGDGEHLVIDQQDHAVIETDGEPLKISEL